MFALLAVGFVPGCADGSDARGAGADGGDDAALGSGGGSSTGGVVASGGSPASGGESSDGGSSVDSGSGEDAPGTGGSGPGETVLRPFAVGSHWNEASKFVAMREAGVQMIRIDISWYHVEPTQGTFNWSSVDTAMAEAEEQGIEVLAVVGYTNDWASSGDSPEYAPLEEYDDEWGNFVQQVVSRYGDDIDAWEIWNEPDHDNFLRMGAGTWAINHHSGASDVDKKRLEYQHLVEIALAQPALAGKVVTTSGFAEGGGFDEGFRGWLEDQPGFLGQFDVASFHTYGYPSYQRLIDVPLSYRATQSAIERADPWPFWITEHGINTTGVDEATVKTYLIRSYAVALAQPGVDKLFWFRAGYDPGHMDLFDQSDNPTAAYDAYQTLTSHWVDPTQIEPWASSGTAQGSIATLLDRNRVAIVWDDDGATTIDAIDLDVAEAFDQDGNALSTGSALSKEPVFLTLTN